MLHVFFNRGFSKDKVHRLSFKFLFLLPILAQCSRCIEVNHQARGFVAPMSLRMDRRFWT